MSAARERARALFIAAGNFPAPNRTIRVGARYGAMTVLRRSPIEYSRWEARCECGALCWKHTTELKRAAAPGALPGCGKACTLRTGGGDGSRD